MSIDEFLKAYPDVQVTGEQLACCHYLQREGQIFLVDFGYANAPDKVWAAMDAELAEMEMPR